MHTEEKGRHEGVMTTALSAATQLFVKDADLDRNDVLGEIDLGAARRLMTLACEAARHVLAEADDRNDARSQALRQVAELVASPGFAVDENGMALIGALLSNVDRVAEDGATFASSLDAVRERMAQPQR